MKRERHNKILLTDNSSEYRHSLLGFFELEGYSVDEAETIGEAISKLEKGGIQLAIVDLRLEDDDNPDDVSGLRVAKFASENNIPCIIVTAFPTVELARIALRSHKAEPYAKDLIPKASGAQALLDSIHLTLENTTKTPNKKSANKLTIDINQKLVWKKGTIIKLSKLQYKMVEELYKKDGGVCTYAELIKSIYGETLLENSAVNDKRLRNLVDRTKEKIEDPASDHIYIEVVFGRGYRLNFPT